MHSPVGASLLAKEPDESPQKLQNQPTVRATDHHKAKSTEPYPASADLEAWQLNITSSHRP
jgi:hypothetical protein